MVYKMQVCVAAADLGWFVQPHSGCLVAAQRKCLELELGLFASRTACVVYQEHHTSCEADKLAL